MPEPTVTAPNAKPKVTRHGGGSRLLNLILLIGIIAAIALFVRSEMKNRQAAQQLQQTQQELETIRKSTNANGEEVAKQVLDKVRKLIDVPNEPAPTVATIVDVEKLKEANEFYKNAKNGNNLIITDKRAILYDPERNVIVDVVPVVVDPNASVSPTPVGQSPAPGAPAATVAPTTAPATSTPSAASATPTR
jgi:cell division septation protein DedD